MAQPPLTPPTGYPLGIRPKNQWTPPPVQVPVIPSTGLQSAMINTVFMAINEKRNELTRRLITEQIPAVTSGLAQHSMEQAIPGFVLERVRETIQPLLKDKVKLMLPVLVSSALVDKFGPAVVNTMMDLKDGTLVCSKPCTCGPPAGAKPKPKPKSPTKSAPEPAKSATDTCAMPVPEPAMDTCAMPSAMADCIETCPCIIAKKKMDAEKERIKAQQLAELKKLEEEKKKAASYDFDKDGKPICPCMKKMMRMTR